MRKPLPDIDQVYNLVLQEEKQRSLTAMTQFLHGSTAFNASFYGKDAYNPIHGSSITDHSAFTAQQKPYNLGYTQQRSSHNSYKLQPRSKSQS